MDDALKEILNKCELACESESMLAQVSEDTPLSLLDFVGRC